MKLISWNLKSISRGNNMAYVLEKLPSDIYFFQESYHPLTYFTENQFEKIKNNFIWLPTENGWGNLIYSKNIKLSPIPFGLFKGRVLLASVYINQKKIILVNIHVPITKGLSRNNLIEIFNKISPLIKNETAIIAGDFNFGKCFDSPNKKECSQILENILIGNNLIDAYSKEEKRTFRPNHKEVRINRIDHIFVSRSLKDTIIDCDIIENEEIITRSDHNPIIIGVNV